MPFRDDPNLWFNIRGIVAAYQPVSGPNTQIVRYNQARGGQNTYRAADGTAPTWSPGLGWTFAAASSQYLLPGISPTDTTWSAFVRFSGVSGAQRALFGFYGSSTSAFDIQISATHMEMYNGDGYATGYLAIAPQMASGVYGFAGKQPYRNGVAEASVIPAGGFVSTPIYIGGLNLLAGYYFLGSIQAIAFYQRTLSAAEARLVSLQMQYCDTNPEWSAWARRRQWWQVSTSAAPRFINAQSIDSAEAFGLASLHREGTMRVTNAGAYVEIAGGHWVRVSTFGAYVELQQLLGNVNLLRGKFGHPLGGKL